MRIHSKNFVRGTWARNSVFAAAVALTVLRIGAIPLSAASAPQNRIVASVIEDYRRQVPHRMSAEGIPGFAIAVVDDQGLLWAEGFGYTDWNRKFPVTADTAFSIQSMSKSFTATATLFAVQDGLVDLDMPISTYLPDFHVNSIFEERPEQHITLRKLLTHTAGFAHEAPVGNNYDFPCHTFEAHIASITNTWLKFPVGRRYSYSNLGIDVAGYVLQVRSGKSFPEYVKEKVLVPLQMRNSTLSVPHILAMRDRAIGHRGPLLPPAGWLIIPSGGVWASANDMARFLRFHINRGALDGTSLLRQDLADTMYTSPDEASYQANYALGIYRFSKNGARLLQHGGGGFGFNCNMLWYPELKLGAVALANKEHRKLCFDLPGEILDKIVAAQPEVYAERAKTKPPAPPARGPSQETVLSDSALERLIAARTLPGDEAALQRWKKCSGKYVSAAWGVPDSMARVHESNGHLFLDKTPLAEVQPGLFFTSTGDTLDLRGPEPTLRNVRVIKVNERTLALRLGLYTVCGLLFFSVLAFGPVRWLLRRHGRKHAAESGVALRWSHALVALAATFSLVCLALLALVPNLIYVPWPASHRELYSPALAVIMILPYANLALAAGAALLMAVAWGKRNGTRAVRIYQSLIPLALLAFNLVLLI